MSARSLIQRVSAMFPHLSDRALALKIGMPPSTLCKAKQNKGSFSLAGLQRMAEALDIRIGILADWLVEPDETVPPSREYSPMAMSELSSTMHTIARRSRAS